MDLDMAEPMRRCFECWRASEEKKNIPAFMQKVKDKKVKLMGFGHRVYKNYDPRAKIVRKVADKVFNILGREPLIEVAEALEKAALSDPYFIKRKLYPNVDFYSGLIYKALGFRRISFLCCLPFHGQLVGWRIGMNFWMIRRIGLCDQGKCTRVQNPDHLCR